MENLQTSIKFSLDTSQLSKNETFRKNVDLLNSIDLNMFDNAPSSIEMCPEKFCWPDLFIEETQSKKSGVSFYDSNSNQYQNLISGVNISAHYVYPFTPINLFNEKLKRPSLNKALFLDRDGIVIKDTHYPHKPEDLEFIPMATQLIKNAQSLNYKVILISNQAGVAKEKFTLEQMNSFHKLFVEQLKNKFSITFDDVFYCPYLDHFDRKPSPGMLLKAVQKHDIAISNSIMVGDKPSDNFEFKGMSFFLLKSQYCDQHPSLITDLSEVNEQLT